MAISKVVDFHFVAHVSHNASWGGMAGFLDLRHVATIPKNSQRGFDFSYYNPANHVNRITYGDWARQPLLSNYVLTLNDEILEEHCKTHVYLSPAATPLITQIHGGEIDKKRLAARLRERLTVAEFQSVYENAIVYTMRGFLEFRKESI